MLRSPGRGSVMNAEVDSGTRIEALDILRGIALLGMIVVNFIEAATPPTGPIEQRVESFYLLFLSQRFYTMFALLFGVSFAVQLRRADGRRDRFVLRSLRRLGTLAVFGLVTEIVFGFYVLVSYALLGLPLLLVRRWSSQAILVLAIVCAVSPPAYAVARISYDAWRNGNAQALADWRAEVTNAQAELRQLGERMD